MTWMDLSDLDGLAYLYTKVSQNEKKISHFDQIKKQIVKQEVGMERNFPHSRQKTERTFQRFILLLDNSTFNFYDHIYDFIICRRA